MPVASSSCSAALGASALRGAAEFEPPLQRLLASGALQKTAGGALQLAEESPSSSSACRSAVLAAALLAPLLATYLEVLRAVQGVLASAGQDGGNGSSSSSSKALCLAAHKQLLSLAAACDAACSGRSGRLVVPSVALAQGAITSFTAVGILVPAEAAQQQQGQQPASSSGRGGALAGSEAAGAAAGGVAQRAQASGRLAGNGAVDEEYAVEPSTPESSGALGQAVTATAAADSTADTADSGEASGEVSGDDGGSGRKQSRQSLDRRRRRHRSSSRSGSDSELDPAADSVAANLCQMASSPPRALAAKLPAPPPRAGVGGAVSEEQQWVLAAAGPAMQQLLDRIEAFICI